MPVPVRPRFRVLLRGSIMEPLFFCVGEGLRPYDDVISIIFVQAQ